MTELLTTINLLASLAMIAYIVNKNSGDIKDIVREVTKAQLAKDMYDYVETIPEDNEEEPEEMTDEIEDINDVDEKVLIKHLTKKYERIEN